MKSIFGAELYKLGRNWLLWLFVALSFLGIGIYFGLYEAEVFGLYRGLALFGLPSLAWLPWCFLTAIATGLAIGGDFSAGTVKNALAVGVSRRDYYFARMGVQMLLTALGFGLGQLAYIVCRTVRPGDSWESPGREIQMFGVKLALYLLVALLQLFAYVSVVNAVCYFLKRQMAAMVAGMVSIYIEAILRQMAESGDLEALLRITRHLPARILYNLFALAAYDNVLTTDFLECGPSALAIIAVSSIAGYVKFAFFPGES